MSLDSRLNIYLKLSPAAKPKLQTKIQPPRLGYLRQTSYGEVWVVDWQYEIGQFHGRHEIAKTSGIPEIFDFKLKYFDPSIATVIDTETTGTYAFIIGAGFWRDDKFIVRQYLMRDFNEEPAQLAAFAEDFTGSAITYNGKCFDLPLLTSRYRLHRFEIPFADCPHLDMLFPCRRIWKRSLSGFKLTQMEQAVLGYARVDDIPSYLIPSIFFDYLQTRDETLLYPILNHNRDDILSLYHLTGIASTIINENLEHGGNDDELLLSLAEIYFNNADHSTAIALIEKINFAFASDFTKNRALLLKAIANKKLGQWDDAIDGFNTLNNKARQIDLYIESAKIYEHKLKDPVKALELVRKAEALNEFAAHLGAYNPSITDALSHRKKRLQFKITRLLHI